MPCPHTPFPGSSSFLHSSLQLSPHSKWYCGIWSGGLWSIHNNIASLLLLPPHTALQLQYGILPTGYSSSQPASVCILPMD